MKSTFQIVTYLLCTSSSCWSNKYSCVFLLSISLTFFSTMVSKQFSPSNDMQSSILQSSIQKSVRKHVIYFGYPLIKQLILIFRTGLQHSLSQLIQSWQTWPRESYSTGERVHFWLIHLLLWNTTCKPFGTINSFRYGINSGSLLRTVTGPVEFKFDCYLVDGGQPCHISHFHI